MSDFKKVKEELRSKEKFYNLLTDRNITDNKYDHVLNVWNKFKIETIKDYHDFKMWFFIISWCVWKV